jgi:phosphoribosylformylglycinamidine cyclo-ligase
MTATHHRSTDGPLTYRRAGVDISAANALVGRLRALAAATHGQQVRPYGDAYAGLYALEAPPGALLAATCDGVGTKLLLGQLLHRYRGLGQDLVAMNVNDLLPCGARPLFFLDYLAAGRLDGEALGELVAGMAAACRTISCALLGGETAEMPGVYGGDGLDMAGFAVGFTTEERLPRRQAMAPGDLVLGLRSTGVHANGLSLARRAVERAGLALADTPPGLAEPLGQALLTPTALYVNDVLSAFERCDGGSLLRAAAHVTGGGLLGRARGLLSDGQRLRIVLDPAAWPRPPIFDVLQSAGQIAESEMARTFNMGLGFLLVATPAGAERLLAMPDTPWLGVGKVIAGAPGVDLGYTRSDERS